uniref:Coat protein n=1 Tax=Bacteriophage sp. TaxID=38018 RepID=A0A7G8LRJ7_9VIRU|nr:MAG: coat protein [Bacteriophage sp.]
MATLRSDIIIPEIFTPYVIEQTTLRDAFLASGVVQPMAELNATEGGDFINVPFWKANLTGDFEVLSDSTSLTPGKITADKQVGVILHRGRAFESRDLAALAAGADPMAAIGAKVADYIANQRQKDLLSCLDGVFGSLGTTTSAAAFFGLSIDGESGDTPTALGPRQVAEAKSLLGDQGDKLTAVAMHSAVYYDLVERKAIDYVSTTEARGATTIKSSGSIAAAYGGDNAVPTYMGLRVIVSDDLRTAAPASSTDYPVYFFTQGAIASGEQMGMQTETDRDILAKSDAMSIDLHYVYHPVGAKWTVGTTNPTPAALATIGNWTKVYETKNLGIVRATVTSNFD